VSGSLGYSKLRLMRGFCCVLAKRTKSSAVFKILGLKAAVTYQNEACFEAGQCLARFDWSVWIVSGSVTGCILFDP
ncbi:hypothetical protein, partial [Sutterella wadsworthensis]